MSHTLLAESSRATAHVRTIDSQRSAPTMARSFGGTVVLLYLPAQCVRRDMQLNEHEPYFSSYANRSRPSNLSTAVRLGAQSMKLTRRYLKGRRPPLSAPPRRTGQAYLTEHVSLLGLAGGPDVCPPAARRWTAGHAFRVAKIPLDATNAPRCAGHPRHLLMLRRAVELRNAAGKRKERLKCTPNSPPLHCTVGTLERIIQAFVERIM